jgi:5-methylcytosine-specific restriction endonuclease McrA
MMARCLTSKKLRAALYVASEGKCRLCGDVLNKGWHADHIVPYSKTKTTNVHDMQALCAPCNLRKANK